MRKVVFFLVGLAGLLSAAPPALAATAPAPFARIVGAAALGANGHVQTRFHRGERIELRVRWQVQAARPGAKIVILWSVRHGRQVVYRHYRVVAAQTGRWRITAQARIPGKASLGVYTFEGKIVVGHKATYRIFTLRVVR